MYCLIAVVVVVLLNEVDARTLLFITFSFGLRYFGFGGYIRCVARHNNNLVMSMEPSQGSAYKYTFSFVCLLLLTFIYFCSQFVIEQNSELCES